MTADSSAPRAPAASEAPPPARGASVSPFASLDPVELRRAWRTMRAVATHLDRVAQAEGWPVPFAPLRYLALAYLDEASPFGLSPRRLAHLLSLRPSTLAHHLDALERAGLIARGLRGIHDRRKVRVRLTGEGRYAVRRLTGDALGHPHLRDARAGRTCYSTGPTNRPADPGQEADHGTS